MLIQIKPLLWSYHSSAGFCEHSCLRWGGGCLVHKMKRSSQRNFKFSTWATVKNPFEFILITYTTLLICPFISHFTKKKKKIHALGILTMPDNKNVERNPEKLMASNLPKGFNLSKTVSFERWTWLLSSHIPQGEAARARHSLLLLHHPLSSHSYLELHLCHRRKKSHFAQLSWNTLSPEHFTSKPLDITYIAVTGQYRQKGRFSCWT